MEAYSHRCNDILMWQSITGVIQFPWDHISWLWYAILYVVLQLAHFLRVLLIDCPSLCPILLQEVLSKIFQSPGSLLQKWADHHSPFLHPKSLSLEYRLCSTNPPAFNMLTAVSFRSPIFSMLFPPMFQSST